MYAFPDPSIASAVPASNDEPPRYVEYASDEPVGSSFVTNASAPGLLVVSNAPGVTGKFAESASPPT